MTNPQTTLEKRLEELSNKTARQLFNFAYFHPTVASGEKEAVIIFEAIKSAIEMVEVERGRGADDRLKDTLPLVLYFGNEKDREEFISLVQEAKPNMVAKKVA